MGATGRLVIEAHLRSLTLISGLALTAVAGILILSIVASLVFPHKGDKHKKEDTHGSS